jgi:hypothetical protein
LLEFERCTDKSTASVPQTTNDISASAVTRITIAPFAMKLSEPKPAKVPSDIVLWGARHLNRLRELSQSLATGGLEKQMFGSSQQAAPGSSD